MGKLLNKYLIILLTFIILWVGVLPFVFSKSASFLCERYAKKNNAIVELLEPKVILSLIPVADFTAKKVFLKIEDEEKIFEIQNLKFRLRLLPLISKKVHLNFLVADTILFDTSVGQKIELNANLMEKCKNLGFICDDFDIKNFRILIRQTGIGLPVIYEGKNLIYKLKSRYLQSSLDSKLIVGDKVSKIIWNLYLPKNNDIKSTKFEIDIGNIDISAFKTYLSPYFSDELKSIAGRINIQASKNELKTMLSDFKIRMNDDYKSIIFPEKLDIISKFHINKNQIDFESVKLFSEKINITFSGKVFDYLSKSNTSLNMNVQIDASKIDTIIAMLPALELEELNIYNLKKYKFFGNVIGNISIKGRLPEPDINGNVYINNATLINPLRKNNWGSIIKLKFLGRNFDFDATVPVNGVEKVVVKGSQEIYNIKYADLIVKSISNVDFKKASEIVTPLHEILNFMVGPLKMVDINGVGNIDIHVKGNRKNPHLWGVLNIDASEICFVKMQDLVIKNSFSKFVFNDQDVIFTLEKGLLNNKEISIKGLCSLFGKFDFDIKTLEQPIDNLYKALRKGTLIPEFNSLPNLDKISGISDIELNIYGAVKNANEIALNKNIFAKGTIAVKDAMVAMQNIKIKDLNGNVNVNGVNSDVNFQGKMDNEDLSIKAKINKNIIDLVLSFPKFNPNIFIENVEIRNRQYLPIVSLDAKYKGNIEDFEYEKIKLYSVIIPEFSNKFINYDGGEIVFENNKLFLKKIKGFISNKMNNFAIDLKLEKPFAENSVANGEFVLQSPNIQFLNDIVLQRILPEDLDNLLRKVHFEDGALDLNCLVRNNKLNFDMDLSKYKLIYLPLELPIKIINGNLVFKNDVLNLNKINILADEMPILLDGDIKNLLTAPRFDIYINSKPQQEFIDKYINDKQIYPIKIRGDIVYSAWLKGDINDYDLKALVNMSKDSSVYHFGATVGDVENAIILELISKVIDKKGLRIKEFSYDKLIESQSGKQTRLNMLKAWGGVDVYDDDLFFKDLRIKTNTPTDARIFNIIFRKPNIKQGQFTSDLKINGKLSNPDVLGDFHIFETEIPFFDTTLKNISLSFKEKVIDFSSKGEVLGNDILFNGLMKNKLCAPYHIEKALINTTNLDLNRIVEKLKVSEVDNVSTFQSFEGFNLADITFNNVKLKADSIQLRNINATDFTAVTSLNSQGKFDVKDFVFNIAKGSLSGDYNYDLKTAETGLNLKADKINANDISWALFDLKNQIYGDLTGNINLTCNGTNFQSCMQTLSGNSKFKVKDGRMPKLGSLEYLLKAGNLVKSGFTGLSISNVVDIVTPLKTGDFSEISGLVRIKDGIARNIEISTTGKDLNLFIWGTYNFSTSIADMEVFGYLSRKITNMFGAIGNFSMNTLLNLIPGVDLSGESEILEKINKIPGVEFSSKNYRKFLAEIQGNINGEDYVKSFRWIN